MTHRLRHLVERQYGVVSRAQLRAAGLSDTAIRDRLRRGQLLPLHRGVFAAGHRALRGAGRWRAAALACGRGAVLSHRSAAALWELRGSARSRIEVMSTGRVGARERKIELHQVRSLDPRDVTVHRGIPVTTVARTFVDLAGVIRADALERALAQAEILSLFDLHALFEVLDRSNGRRGAQALRTALQEPPEMTRSDLERTMLGLCRRHGLPRPGVNADVCGFEADFSWPAARLVVETDGGAVHRTRHAFEEDRRRDGELLLAGYRVLRITHRRLRYDEPGVAAMLRRLTA
jgi:very-short-patch-repair endonuclease